MPITTPETYLDKYRDGAEHFKHVLECLFKPSVEKAGNKAIPPIAKGADLIHAEIIKNLEQSDLVLCDMSCLNPNVFFEFGIRTSLNKPVCVVKDEHTKHVPFDTAILNHLEYSSTLETWEIGKEIERLAEHIQTSHQRSKEENSLWKYFGLRTEARAYEGETGTDTKLDYLSMQVESLRDGMAAILQTTESYGINIETERPSTIRVDDTIASIWKYIPTGVEIIDIRHTSPNHICLVYRGPFGTLNMRNLRSRIKDEFGVTLRFQRVPKDFEVEHYERGDEDDG